MNKEIGITDTGPQTGTPCATDSVAQSTAAFTPGPWDCWDMDESGWHVFATKFNRDGKRWQDCRLSVAQVRSGRSHINNSDNYYEGVANAILIAAAPEMLDLHKENARILGFLVNELQGRVEFGKLAAIFCCLERSRAAISKATISIKAQEPVAHGVVGEQVRDGDAQ